MTRAEAWAGLAQLVINVNEGADSNVQHGSRIYNCAVALVEAEAKTIRLIDEVTREAIVEAVARGWATLKTPGGEAGVYQSAVWTCIERVKNLSVVAR